VFCIFQHRFDAFDSQGLPVLRSIWLNFKQADSVKYDNQLLPTNLKGNRNENDASPQQM
jgi:hypothetical protein